MLLRTQTKLALARAALVPVMTLRSGLGRGPIVECRRGGFNWKLDLREGIDFSIFLLGSFEPEVVRAYRRKIRTGSTVLDIGANIGAHALPLAGCVGPSGRVIAVEPTTYAYRKLVEHVAANPKIQPRVTAVQAMLMGTSQADLAQSIPSSWPLRPCREAHPEHGGVPKQTDGARVTTVDALADELNLRSVDFVKLDVDGYEVEVLRGARRVLREFKPTILFEYSPYVVREHGYDPAEILERLAESGYSVTHLSGRAAGGNNRQGPEVPVGAGVNLMAHPQGRL